MAVAPVTLDFVNLFPGASRAAEIPMSEDTLQDELDQPWIVTEADEQLELCHEHRWLGILGIPLALFGLFAACGIWFLPDLNRAEDWPILAGGSLIGFGMALLGMHVTFNRERFIADKRQGSLIHRSGFGPFIRTRRYPLNDVEQLVCEPTPDAGTSGDRYSLSIVASSYAKRIATFVEAEPILWEGLRWSLFLDKPLVDRTQTSRKQDLQRRLAEKQDRRNGLH